jgi:hypothetical protein
MATQTFRFFFIYFFIQAVPLDWKYYQQVFSINWANLRYGDIFILAHYTPQFVAGANSFANWAFVAVLAAVGAIGWTVTDKNKTTFSDNLYYWIRVIVRYRLAIGIIAYGFIKVFPLQSPYPSISNLNTNYDDFTRWKLFSLSLGIVPSYESFLGVVEVVAGLLLLFRKTASTGAFIVLLFTGNVFMSNWAYEGGELVYSLYLITLALFVLAFDIQRLSNLLILQRPTVPNLFKPVFGKQWQFYGRLALKTAVVFFFVIVYSFKTATGYRNDPYQFPTTNGLGGVSGIYNVKEFRVNADTIAYSKTDPIRWQDVVFEKWNTISIRSNRPVIIDSNNTEKITAPADSRTYELEGTAGRHYYSYISDTIHHTLRLQNKNKHHEGEKLVLNYQRTNDSTIILNGINENKDSVFVILERINKKYLLEEVAKQGRGKSIKL